MTAAARYGLVGLGNMGRPMAANLSRTGVDMVVFDAAGSAERAPAGAHPAASLADLAARADTVFLSLPDGDAVVDVLAQLGGAPDRAVSTVVDLSTVGIRVAQRAFAEARAMGLAYVDAPVSGGRSGAVEATISVMWAGPADVLEAHRPALESMARHIFHVGTEAGQGQALKLLNNFLSATSTAATGEAVLFGLAQGLELKTILDVVNVSTGRSHASADKYVRRVLTGTFDSGFTTRLMAKDMRLFMEAAAGAGTPHEIGDAVRELWDAVDAGLPGSDHMEVFTFLRDTHLPVAPAFADEPVRRPFAAVRPAWTAGPTGGRTSSPAPVPTVVELTHRLASGSTTVEAVARACLERIEACDPAVRAWVHVDPQAVVARARELDEAAVCARGALHGIPLGVKDIFDTHDMPTAYGSPIYAGHRPRTDAASVSIARQCGMLPLGKLVTTEFAAWPPGPTTNPHDATRTPGGSSSGSAAAVASGMVPVAFATQTTGSIIRPAAFCGVVGYKPSYGTLPCVGAKAISESFDTVGVMARTVADAALVVGALSGRALELAAEPAAPRLGICLTYEWPAALPETVALFDALPRLLERAGAHPALRVLPGVFAGLAEAQSAIWTFEIARCLADEHRRFRESIREPLRGMLDDGAAMGIAEYEESLGRLRECRAALAAVFDGVDALVVPSAPGEAPEVATTGDPIFNRVWSALGTPAVTVPAGAGPSGLPLGVQVVGLPGRDARVLACAAWIEEALAGAAERRPG